MQRSVYLKQAADCKECRRILARKIVQYDPYILRDLVKRLKSNWINWFWVGSKQVEGSRTSNRRHVHTPQAVTPPTLLSVPQTKR
jgi:hypothetical protein